MLYKPVLRTIPFRGFNTKSRPRWKYLVDILSPEKGHLTGAAIALSATSGGTVAFPYFTGKLMDSFAASTKTPDVWLELVNTNAAACVGALTLVGLGGFVRAYLLETSSGKISRRLRLQLFQSLLSKPQTFFDSAKTGDLVSRLGSDVTGVSRSIMDGAFGFRVLINAVAGTVMVAKTVPLAIFPQLLAPVVAMFVGGVVYGSLVKGIARRQTEALSHSTQIAEENLSLIRVVKMFNGESKSITDYSKSLDALYALSQSNALATGGRVTAFVTIGGGFILHVIYNCGMLISAGTLTVGQTSALAGYLLICGNAYQGLVTSYGDIQKALGACDRIVHLMTPSNEPKSEKPIVFTDSIDPPSIRFSDVHFSYSSDDSSVFSGLNLYVPAGAKQAIVGLSGSGKSSVLNLLGGLYVPSAGSIYVNDTDMSRVDDRLFREHVAAYVPQETALFNDSIRNNVWFPQSPPEDAAKAETNLVEAARLSFVTDWNETVGERGQNLSGGERQRIAIARALCKNKPLILLDEATSALDRESDAIVLEYLKKLDSTIIAVTHRMSAIEWSERLTVIADGKVVQEGQTEELLRHPGPELQRLLTTINGSS